MHLANIPRIQNQEIAMQHFLFSKSHIMGSCYTSLQHPFDAIITLVLLSIIIVYAYWSNNQHLLRDFKCLAQSWPSCDLCPTSHDNLLNTYAPLQLNFSAMRKATN